MKSEMGFKVFVFSALASFTGGLAFWAIQKILEKPKKV